MFLEFIGILGVGLGFWFICFYSGDLVTFVRSKKMVFLVLSFFERIISKGDESLFF